LALTDNCNKKLKQVKQTDNSSKLFVKRILAITTINQLIVGLACMDKNKNENHQYTDYLIINNTMLSDLAVDAINSACKSFQFSKVIDLRERLSQLDNSNRINYSILKLIQKAITITMHYRIFKNIIKSLIESVGINQVNEVYFRYKLNVAEKILFHAFSKKRLWGGILLNASS